MDKLTRLYKMMYGSMDTLFVNRREDHSHKHNQSAQLATCNLDASPSSSSKVSGYSSMTELSQITTDSLSSHSRATELPPHLPNKARHREKSRKLQSHHYIEESSSSTSHGDSDSCYSDTYSVSFRTVNVLSDIKYHQPVDEQQASGAQAPPHPNRPARLTPFLSKALSQSSQSLPTIASSSSKSTPHKGSFSDLLARKKNKKSKAAPSAATKSSLETTSNLQHSASTSQLSSARQQVTISSMKDLVEVLIYQLQVMERCQAQLTVQNQNLERANKIYQQKLELAARETELVKQKAAMLEVEVWRCYLCSRDKISLYSADVCVVSLACGHLFCAQCATDQREQCPKCLLPFTIDRRVHL